MFEPLKKYADFKGRASRNEFWPFYLFTLAIYILARIIFTLYGLSPDMANLIASATQLPLLIPIIAVFARRFHDLDRSGWWTLMILVPIIGFIGILIYFCFKGTTGKNRFGPDPVA